MDAADLTANTALRQKETRRHDSSFPTGPRWYSFPNAPSSLRNSRNHPARNLCDSRFLTCSPHPVMSPLSEPTTRQGELRGQFPSCSQISLCLRQCFQNLMGNHGNHIKMSALSENLTGQAKRGSGWHCLGSFLGGAEQAERKIICFCLKCLGSLQADKF